MSHLSVIVTTLLPCRDPRIAGLLETLCRDCGCFTSADAIAGESGFETRHRLRRALQAVGLPPLTRLAQWIRVLGWALEAESRGVPLAAAALQNGEDPAVRYRLIRKLTGTPWSVAAEMGFGWFVHRLLDDVYLGAAKTADGRLPKRRKEGRKTVAG